MRRSGGNKVVFIDSWTKGIPNFARFQGELSARGVECLLIHRGSWGAEPDRPTEEVIEGLRCRDIRHYHGLVYSALRAERPNLVLILTTNYIADRAVILAARALGIQTCFLMHGIRYVGTNGSAPDEAPMARRFLRALRWKRAFKYLRHTIPDYFRSGTAADASFPFRPGPYRTLVNTFLFPERYVLHPDPTPELHADRALVWAEVYKDLFVADYGYPAERVRVVGHPPLDAAFRLAASPMPVAEREAFLEQHGIAADEAFAVYLEDGLVETGFEGWTSSTRIAHLEEIARVCDQAGRILVIKLHPITEAGGIHDHFSGDSRVRVVGRADLPRLILLSESVIGHISSTVDIAIALKKPVVVPRWGISAVVPDYFVHRGVAIGCESPDALRSALRDSRQFDTTTAGNVQRYVERFITWQDGRSVERIMDNIIEQMNLGRS